MGNVQILSHSKCEYIYLTWIPKYRKKKIYKELRKYLVEVFGELARQKEWKAMNVAVTIARRRLYLLFPINLKT